METLSSSGLKVKILVILSIQDWLAVMTFLLSFLSLRKRPPFPWHLWAPSFHSQQIFSQIGEGITKCDGANKTWCSPTSHRLHILYLSAKGGVRRRKGKENYSSPRRRQSYIVSCIQGQCVTILGTGNSSSFVKCSQSRGMGWGGDKTKNVCRTSTEGPNKFRRTNTDTKHPDSFYWVLGRPA